MKLYTEEQVNVAMRLMVYDRATFKQTLEILTPIELPSDAEIEEASPYIPSSPKIDYLSHQKGFYKGAKWIKEQILNQNEYYNQTYNQKQYIIDIMKADEDDGLYNQNKS
jgi:hypothetical protein